MSTPVLSTPMLGTSSIGRFDAMGNFHRNVSAQPEDIIAQQEGHPFPSQQSNRRDSFGSVFPGSSGTGGNGNGNGTGHGTGMATSAPRMGTTQSVGYGQYITARK